MATKPTIPPGPVADFYVIGFNVHQAAEGGRAPDGTAERLASEFGVSKSAINKAYQFVKLYSWQDLRELCSLKGEQGKPLGIGHVYELIQVKNRADRKKLQELAAGQGWSSRRLREYREQKYGYPVVTKRGRKPRRAANLDEALLQLAHLADQWIRWEEALANPIEFTTREFTIRELPTSVRVKLLAATDAVRALAETLERRNIRKRKAKHVNES